MSTASIGWIGEPGGAGPRQGAEQGRWGTPDALTIPLNDRGLLLADGLFETVLVEHGRPMLLEAHLQRWQHSAALLGMAPPPPRAPIEQLVAQAMQRSGISTGALRLNWSRGGGGRGIDAPLDEGGPRFWLQFSATNPGFEPVAVIVSPTERRCATSVLSRCKTFAYGPAIQARRQARAAGVDDALLETTAGGLCCGSTANLLLECNGRWLTPPSTSGCLPGVMRQRALDLSLIEEAQAPIGLDAVESGVVTAAWLLNSLGCRPITGINNVPLARVATAAARRFWRQLLAAP
jgi:branched-subunit amino acid aminotransferase/4-amino-4-deoxychorismate lyase